MRPIRLWAMALLLLILSLSIAPPSLALLRETHSLLGTIVEITILSRMNREPRRDWMRPLGRSVGLRP